MQRIELGFLLAVTAFLFGFSLLGVYHYDYPARLMLFPLLGAGLTLVVVFIHLALLARNEARSLAGKALGSEPRSTQAQIVGSSRQSIVRLLLVFSVVPLVFLFGYPLGLAAYLLFVLKCFGESWPLSVGVSASSLLLTIGIFVHLLGVPIPLVPDWWMAIAR